MKGFHWLVIIMFSSTLFVSCEEIDLGLTEEQIAEGLKEALRVGADTAVAKLNIENGFFEDQLVKIFLPEEAQPAYNVISSVPILSDMIDKTILTINRAAEDAAIEAKPIFVDAITGITITDAINILNGEDTAATGYLRGATYQQLYDAFKPKIATSLNKDIVLGISAEDSYSTLINTYNNASLGGFLFDKIEDNTLADHTTARALKGVFMKVGDEETNIRTDVSHRVNDVLKTVFAEQD
jgi:hypothetical protein